MRYKSCIHVLQKFKFILFQSKRIIRGGGATTIICVGGNSIYSMLLSFYPPPLPESFVTLTNLVPLEKIGFVKTLLLSPPDVQNP